jgi:cytoskeleton protein RodZ
MKRPLRPDIVAAEAAARAGEELREARLALGLTLEEVAQRLRIRRVYLQALEEGRLGDLPAAVYAVGFLRSYAEALGLDAEAMIRRFRERGAAAGPRGLAGAVGGAAAAAGRRTDLVFPEPPRDRGMPAGLVVLAGAVVAIGAYAAWYNWSGSADRIVDAVPPVPSRFEQVVGEAAGPAAPPERAGSGLAPTARIPSTPGAATSPRPVVAAAGEGGTAPAGASPATPTQALAATVTAPAVPGPAATGEAFAAAVPGGRTPAPAEPERDAAVTTAPDPTPAAGRVVLHARAETWVSVREANGGRAALLNRILRPGETFAVPPREGLVLSVGRPDALEVLVDGEPVAVFDGPRGRRSNIPLDADRLKAGPAGAAQSTTAQRPTGASPPR